MLQVWPRICAWDYREQIQSASSQGNTQTLGHPVYKWSIAKGMHDYVCTILPQVQCMLELPELL